MFRSTIKKRLERNAQDAPGSPPPELPNHVIILWPVGPTVNVTFVTSHFDRSTARTRTISNCETRTQTSATCLTLREKNHQRRTRDGRRLPALLVRHD